MMGLFDFLLEVFRLRTQTHTPTPSRPTPSPELDVPWRPVDWNEKDEILKELEDLNPSVEPLRILLHGPVGAGKSCFVNSVQRVLLGRNVISALENTTGTGESFTTSIKTHKMKKRGGGHYPFVFSDIMGLEVDKGGIDTGDIIKVLEGHILDGYKFNPRRSITEDNPKYNPCPKPFDNIHCLMSIVPADSIRRIHENMIDKLRAIQKTASDLSIPQVIVLTKVDGICDMVKGNLRKVYHSRKIKEKIKMHKMKKRGGGHYPFVFSDIMGLEADKGGIHTRDIIKVLEGHISDGYMFNPKSPITEDNPEYNRCPNLSDKVHCLVSIVPADAISRMDHSVIDKMRTIRKTASDLSIPQVIVLTKVDEACQMVREDLRKLYHSRNIKEKVEESSIQLGVPIKNIYPVKNYHAEITEDKDVDVIILMALMDIVNFVENMYEQSDH